MYLGNMALLSHFSQKLILLLKMETLVPDTIIQIIFLMAREGGHMEIVHMKTTDTMNTIMISSKECRRVRGGMLQVLGELLLHH